MSSGPVRFPALRLVPPDTPLPDLAAAVGAALAGGVPMAPLPADPVARQRAAAALQPDRPVTEPGAALLVTTSGSTGEPKGVVLSAAAVRASAEATHDRLGGPGHWLLALPTHYVAGLMVVARAVAAGRPVEPVGADLAWLAAVLDRCGGGRHYLSLVPTQLHRALVDPRSAEALGRVDAVLLGGAPATPELLARAAAAGVRVVSTYGMSETCGGCVYDGVPLAQVTVRIDTAAGVAGGDGRVLLGGPTVFSGYRLRPDLTEQTLLGGLVRTTDRGRCVDGRLQVLGRYDDVIISGGMKIDTGAVETAARAWPALAGAEIALVGVPDPDWGSRLVAFVDAGDVDAGDTTLSLPGLRDHLAGRCARHELPTELVLLDRLPRTSSGKTDRQRLRRGVDGLPVSRRERREVSGD